jgi:uncharacterized RDD family membrane protein YckC
MQNPYAAPTAPLGLDEAEGNYSLASRGQRFANFLLDTIFLYIFAIVVGVALGLLFGDALFGDERNTGLDLLFGVMLTLLYYAIPEALWGKTAAKLITKTQAFNKDGSRLTWGRAIGRSFCRWIPFEPFSFFGGDNEGPRGWHDKISGTKVVSLK